MSWSSSAIMRFIMPLMSRSSPFPDISASYRTSVPPSFGESVNVICPFIAFPSTWSPSCEGGRYKATWMVDSMVRFPAFRVSFHPVPTRNGPGVMSSMLWTEGIHCFVCPRSARTEKTRSGGARMTAVLVKDMAQREGRSLLRQPAADSLSTPVGTGEL